VGRRVSTNSASTSRSGRSGRLACIDLRAFPLQLLLGREMRWRGLPVVVVEEDKPQARILWLNEKARGLGILPGMRYAAGLALCSELCAGVVPQSEIAAGVTDLTKRLRRFGPEVEPKKNEPGVFWLGAGGLKRVFLSLDTWLAGIRGALAEAGFASGIAVGYSRFSVYALVRSLRDARTIIVPDPDRERVWTKRVRLSRLHVDATARDHLAALGIETVGDLLKLPPAGLRQRFGEEIHGLHAEARGLKETPLQAEEVLEPLREELLLDDGEKNSGRLLFLVKRLLDPLLERMAARRLALAELKLELKLERGAERVEILKPADPTLDRQQILDLALLRLEALRLRAGVIELALEARGLRATQTQLDLFAERPKRDPAAAKRVFARLKAEFGERAVVYAKAREGHLPEGTFAWTPMAELPASKPRVCQRTLVRRMQASPYALPRRPRHEEDGWQLRGREDAAVDRLEGPYVLSGGWWRAADVEVRREYHFARTRKGEWLWVFRDPNRRRWYLHGRVE